MTARVGAIVPQPGLHELPLSGCSYVFVPCMGEHGITVLVFDGQHAREMGTHIGTPEECEIYLDAWIHGALAMRRM